MKRRDFIKHLPLGLAAASVPFSVAGLSGRAFASHPLMNTLLNTQSDNDRILVIINLQGGNDGLNTVIPFQDSNYDTYRKDIGFVSSAEKAKLAPFALRSDLALNYVMGDPFMNLFKAGKLAVIQNVGYADPSRSHFRATDIWNSASDSSVVISTGWVGRYLQTMVPDDYPIHIDSPDPVGIAISTATTLIYQGDKAVLGVAVSDPSNYTSATDYPDDTPPATAYGNELAFVHGILAQSDKYGTRFKDLFDTTKHPNATKNTVTYPTSSLAKQLQKVAWCINAGMTTKVYFVQQTGYDTHVNQFSNDSSQTGQGMLLKDLAEAITAFQQDVENMGFGDRVVGMTYSEFGRRVNQNGSNGTDHGTCAPMFVFGTGINGEVYGNNPSLTNLDIYGDLINQFDFRQIYAALLGQWFGVDDTLRKAILNNHDVSTLQFPVNGTGAMQNLIKNPISSVGRQVDSSFQLYQNYPNPVRDETTIRFDLASGAMVRLEVFDARGELISTVASGYHGQGSYGAPFNTAGLASGTYYYRLDAGGVVATRVMTIVK